jgi:O-antigen/teichoic acid export membrane protein
LLVSLFILAKNNVFIAFISYVLTITLANLLGPEIFGKYSLILVIASILSLLINFGTNKTAPVTASEKGINFVLRETLTIRFIMLAFCIFCLAIYSIYNQDTAFYIFCLLFTGVNLGFYFEISSKNIIYSYVYLFERTMYITSIFFVIYFSTPSLDIIFTFFLLTTLVSLGFQYHSADFKVKNIFITNFQTIGNIFIKHTPLVVIALSTLAFGGFSRIILEDGLGLEKMGIYSAGWQLVTIGTIFQSQVTRVWRLKMSTAITSNNKSLLMTLIKSYFIFATVPFVFLVTFLFISSDQVVDFLFTSEYSELANVLPTLSIYYIVINLAGLVDVLWVAVDKNKLYMYINILFGLLLLVFLSLISDNASLIDFAISTIIVHMAMVLVLAIIWYRNFLPSS